MTIRRLLTFPPAHLFKLGSLGLFCLFAGCGGKEEGGGNGGGGGKKEEAALDRSDPTSTASAFVAAYKSKDVKALHALCNKNNAEWFGELVTQGEAHPRYNSIFGDGWRMKAAAGWDGKIRETRYSEDGEALVHFGNAEDGELAVVVLTDEGGKWGFEDIHSMSAGRYAKESKTKP